MNLDSASNSSGQPSNPRASRGQIAAQACETCRARKQKCDEQRPKCSLCQRMKLECRYREPQPTKKDKTLVEILDKLKQIETKVDRIPTSRGPVGFGFGSIQPSPSSQPSFNTENETNSYSASSLRPTPSRGSSRYQAYRHTTAAHQILTWPAIRQLLQASSVNLADLQNLEQDGSAFLVKLPRPISSLPLDDALQERPFFGMQSQATRVAGGARITFPTLTVERMYTLTNSYFDSFNLLYPFMDRQSFMSETLAKVKTEGFDGDTDSVLALLVFALGEVAIDGYREAPVEYYKGRPSGIRGGTILRPPGLALFNEARKTIGFVLTDCDLANVQILSLAALYYQACSRHVDFWRMTVSASCACQILVTCNQESPQKDLIQRAYWHCSIMEASLHLELALPLTGIIPMENHLGLPNFSANCEQDNYANQSSQFESYSASQVALRRICADLHNRISQSTSSSDAFSDSGPTASTLKRLASDLTEWRTLLPEKLKWPEDDPTANPLPQTGIFSSSLDPNLPRVHQADASLFTANLNNPPVYYPFAYDIQVAWLRTRYYHAKFMVHRPFVYKALHFPEQMTEEDYRGVAECLQSCLKWPLTMAPASRRKRLIPYLFCWSQIFMSILLIIHMTQHDNTLRNIRARYCGPRFELEIGISVDLMLDWIRDLRSSDSIASWCYRILQPIYNLDP